MLNNLYRCLNWVLTRWGRDKMTAIFQTTFWNAFFFNENGWISIKNSQKFIHKGLISNIPAFVQIMAWRRPVNKPLSEPSLLMHICVTRPQWVNLLDSCLDQLKHLMRNVCRAAGFTDTVRRATFGGLNIIMWWYYAIELLMYIM